MMPSVPSLLSFDAQTITDAMVIAVSQNQVSVVRKRLENGKQDVDAQDSDGQTALCTAAMKDNVYLLDLLLHHGANVAGASRDGNTALHLASLWGREDAVRFLLDHQADPGAYNNDHETPLHLAAKSGHAGVLSLLLEKGHPDPHIMDDQGRTPFMIGCGSHVKDCSTALREYQEGPWARHVVNLILVASFEGCYLEMLPESLLAEIASCLAGPVEDLSILLERPVDSRSSECLCVTSEATGREQMMGKLESMAPPLVGIFSD